jgi:hypothetical protein
MDGMNLWNGTAAVCEAANCCYINGGGENLPRFQSMLHGFLAGWLACLHVCHGGCINFYYQSVIPSPYII